MLRHAPLLTEELISDEQVTTFSNRFCPADGRAARVTDVLTKLTLVTFVGHPQRPSRHPAHVAHAKRRLVHPPHPSGAAGRFNNDTIAPAPAWTTLLHHRARVADSSRSHWRSLLQDDGTTPALVYKPRDDEVPTPPSVTITTSQTRKTDSPHPPHHSLPNFHDAARDNRRTRPTVVVNAAWALVLQKLAGHSDVVFGNVTTGRNGAGIPGLDAVVGPCVNMLPTRLCLPPPPGDHTASEEEEERRRQLLLDLVEASAAQVDDRAAHEGLDWDEVVGQCTTWPAGERYRSAVHFRNMAFEPELVLKNVDDGSEDRLVVAWYELVATPHWTTVLVYPEDDVLRLWLLADPAEVGDDGADEILRLLAGFVDEIVAALTPDVDEEYY